MEACVSHNLLIWCWLMASFLGFSFKFTLCSVQYPKNITLCMSSAQSVTHLVIPRGWNSNEPRTLHSAMIGDCCELSGSPPSSWSLNPIHKWGHSRHSSNDKHPFENHVHTSFSAASEIKNSTVFKMWTSHVRSVLFAQVFFTSGLEAFHFESF